MQKPLAILAAGGLIGTSLAVPVVSAQTDDFDYSQCQGRTLSVGAPQNNTTVGRSFVVSGKINTPPNYPDPSKAIFVQIDNDNYLQPADRNNPPYSNQNYYTADANGNFTFTIDLRGNNVVDTTSGKKAVAAGQHRFIFGIVGDKCGGEISAVDLTIREDAAPAVTRTQPQTVQKPAITPIPSPSPSMMPVMATPTAEVKSDKSELDPMAALILGALLGAAILALAEVSAVEYRKKHGLKGDITKKKQ